MRAPRPSHHDTYRDWMKAPPSIFPLRVGDLVLKGAVAWLGVGTVLIADEHGPRRVEFEQVEDGWAVVGCYDLTGQHRRALSLTRQQRDGLAALMPHVDTLTRLATERHHLVRDARHDLLRAMERAQGEVPG